MKRSNLEERKCLYLITDLHIRTFALFSILTSVIRNTRKKTLQKISEVYYLNKRHERLNDDDETVELIYYSSTCFNQTYDSN